MAKREVPSVPIPAKNEHGRCVTYKNGYVYWITDSWWDTESKNSRDNRQIIGKVTPTDDTKMIPNKWYIANLSSFFEDQHILTHNNILAGGVFIGALRAANSMGILNAIKEAFPHHWTRIFATCVYWIDAQTSTAQGFQDWFFDNYCGYPTAMDGSAFTNLFEELSENGYCRDTYWERFHQEYEKLFPTDVDENGKKRCRLLGCDGGNSNTTDRDNEKAGYGHAKDNDDLPIVGYMNFSDEITGITLYWEYHPGPLLDKTEFPYALEKVQELGLDTFHLMMDRGFITKDMIKELDDLKKKHGIEFSAMLPSTFGLVEQVLIDFREKIRNNSAYYIDTESIYGMLIPDEYVKEHFPEYYDGDRALMHICIFYDDKRAATERDNINNKVSALKNALEAKKEYTENLVKEGAKYFIIEPCEPDPKTKRAFTLERKNDIIQQEIAKVGFFLMVGNGDVTATYEIDIARKRDRNEKSFRRRKSFFDLTTPGTGTDKTFTGKMIVADIAQNIEEAMEYYSKSYIQRKSSETFTTAVAEFHKIKFLVNKDGSIRLAYPLTKEQKELVGCFGLTDYDVEQYVRTLHWGAAYDVILSKNEWKQKVKEEKKAQKKAEREAEKARSKAERDAERSKRKAEKEAERKRQKEQRKQ